MTTSKMVTAFKKYEQINSLPTMQEKHREWLKYYSGLKYGYGEDGKMRTGWSWTKKKYSDGKWDNQVNMVGRLPNRTIIEFDGEIEKARKFLEETEKKLQQLKIGYIRSTHHGKSDYLWIEFNREMKDNEIENFFIWIAPEGSEIDLNFASSKKVFPVLFAPHYKHPHRETPVTFFEGEQVDFKSIVPKERQEYKTFKKSAQIFTLRGQAEEFVKKQPLFYDKSGLFWVWNFEEKFWDPADDVDVLNLIQDSLQADVISSKSRNEILNGLKQEARRHIPKPAQDTWVQFKNGLVDVSSPEIIFEPNPAYFITNPIPWNISDDETTPTIDKIFEEWVGAEYVQTLYEIISYCLLPDYPISRIFCFVGAGLNGKSCFLNLLKEFLGDRNVTSTELDILLKSRFEVTRLHKKLACLMGETNFAEMSKTSMLKKLTGNDLVGFEYKNKNPFHEKNYAKILISTNSLPTTTDKTIGFYRRWLILDFPNQFTEKVDILATIPKKEYDNLARKSVTILNKLLSNRNFTNEGNIEERMKRFEDRSNPLEKFLNEYTEESYGEFIWKHEFEKRLNEWCLENRFRNMADITIGKKMKERGIQPVLKQADWIEDGHKRIRAWEGLKWRENTTLNKKNR